MGEEDQPGFLQRFLSAIGRQGSPGSAPRATYVQAETDDMIDRVGMAARASVQQADAIRATPTWENPLTRLLMRGGLQAAGSAASGAGLGTPVIGDGLSMLGDVLQGAAASIGEGDLEQRGRLLNEQISAQQAVSEPWWVTQMRIGTNPLQGLAVDAVQDVRALGRTVAQDPSAGLGYIGSQAVVNAPNMVLPAIGSAVAGPVGALAGSYLLESGALWQQARRAGETGLRSRIAAVAGGAAAAGLDVIGLEGVKKAGVGKALSAGARLLEAGKEIPTEYVQEVVANAAAKAGWGEEGSVLQGALVAGISGGGMSIGSFLAGAAGDALAEPKVMTEADARRNTLEGQYGPDVLQSVENVMDSFAVDAATQGLDIEADDLAGYVAAQLGGGAEQSSDFVSHLADRFTASRTQVAESAELLRKYTEMLAPGAAQGDGATPGVVAEPVIAIRRGEIGEDGVAHFALPGASTYYDEVAADTEVGVDRYDLSGLQIADTSNPEVESAILRAAIERAETADERESLEQVVSDTERGNGIDYTMTDEYPSLRAAAESLGYDGMKVWENDDVGSPSTVFTWRAQAAAKLDKPAGGTVTERPADYETPGARKGLTDLDREAVEALPEEDRSWVSSAIAKTRAKFAPKKGWADVLEVKRSPTGAVRIKKGKPEYQQIAYNFHKAGVSEKTMALRLIKEFRDVERRAAAGDPGAETILAHRSWYSGMRTRLRQRYGGMGDLFADILGATSAQTDVRTNWSTANEALELYTKGAFDGAIQAFDAHVRNGGTIGTYKGPVPLKKNGKKFGANSPNVLLATYNMWRTAEVGSAPKTRNFSGNLIGASDAATIDVWAARLLRRLSGQKRIPLPAEKGVAGKILADGQAGAEFGFGQRVMEEAGRRLGMAPHEVQAIAWFMEKEIWTRNKWTNKRGEGGSMEAEFDAEQADRYVGGVTPQTETGGLARLPDARLPISGVSDPALPATAAYPTTQAMRRFIAPIYNLARRTAGSKFINITPALGRYGTSYERAVGLEFITDPSFSPYKVAQLILRKARDAGQTDAFVAKLLDPALDTDAENVYPGLAIYFHTPQRYSDITGLLADLRAQGVDGFTTISDPSKPPGTITGLRYINIPEISMRWDPDVRETMRDPASAQQAIDATLDNLREVADTVSTRNEVSSARVEAWDVLIAGKESYDREISRLAGLERAEADLEAGDAGRTRQSGSPGTWGRGRGESIAGRLGDLEGALDDGSLSVDAAGDGGRVAPSDPAATNAVSERGPPSYDDYASTTSVRQQLADGKGLAYVVRESESGRISRGFGGAALARLEKVVSAVRARDVAGAPGAVRSPIRVAGVGITRRLYKDGLTTLLGSEVRTTHEVAAAAQVVRDPSFETFRVVVLKDNKVVGLAAVASGMPGVSSTVPRSAARKAREAGWTGSVTGWYVSEALKAFGGDSYYLVHNHPSGQVDASVEDVVATHQAREVPGFRGHVIINSGRYAVISADVQAASDTLGESSYALEGVGALGKQVVRDAQGNAFDTRDLQAVAFEITDASVLNRAGFDPETGRDQLLSPAMSHPALGFSVRNPQDLASVARNVTHSDGFAVLVGRDSNGAARLVAEVDLAWLNDRDVPLSVKQAYLRDVGVATGSRDLFLAHVPDPASGAQMWGVRELASTSVFKDVLFTSGTSAAQSGMTGGGRDMGLDDTQIRERAVAAYAGQMNPASPLYPPAFGPRTTEPVGNAGENVVAEPDPLYRERAAKRIEDADPGEGRPELAIPVQSASARMAVQAVDTEMGRPTPQTFVEWDQAAGAALAADYEGNRARLMRDGAESPVDVAMARMVIERESNAAIADGDKTKIFELVQLVSQYRRVRSEQARALAAGRDPSKTAAQTARTQIQEALLNPSNATARKLESATSAYSRGKILQNEARRIKEAQVALAKQSIDLTALDYDGLESTDKARRAKAMREVYAALRTIGAAKATGEDKAFEWRVNALLSGLRTHTANILGNTISIGWDLTVQRTVEAILNEAIGKVTGEYGDAARLGELKYLLKGAFSREAIVEAWQNAYLSFDTEHGVFSEEMARRSGSSGEPTRLEESGASIGGWQGRTIRVPGRFLTASDELTKTWLSHTQARGEAYRIAKQEGLSGKALEARMDALAADRNSPAWLNAYDKAVELTFQEPVTGTLGHLQNWRSDTNWVRHVFPFIRTPANLLRIGFRKSPLGLIGMAVKGARHMGYKLSTRVDNPALVYTRRQATRDIAEQILAAGVMWYMIGLVGGQDDDDPVITGTKDRQEGARNLGPIQPTSIKAFGKRFDYSRGEPLGTSVALMVDLANTIKRSAKEGILPAVEQMYNIAIGVARDKSSLQGFGELVRLFEGFGSPLTAVGDYASGFAASWSPAIIKHAASAADPLIRDYRPKGDGWEFARDLARATGEQALPLEALAPAARRDVWGREMERTVWPNPISDYVWQVVSPVRVQPEDRVLLLDRALLLNNAVNPEEKWYPSPPAPYFERGGARYDLSRDQYNEFLRLRGKELQKQLADAKLPPFVGDPSLRVRDDSPAANAQAMQLRQFVSDIQRALTKSGSKARDAMLDAGLTPTRPAPGE